MTKSAHALFGFFAIFLVPPILTSSAAQACLGEFSESSIFFDEEDLKAGIDGAAIAKVTITDLSQEFIGTARVDRIIKGPIDGRTIIIRIPASDCTRGFGVGVSGIVIGSLEQDDQGKLALIPIQESNWKREARRKAHSLPTR